MHSPSFNRYSSGILEDIAARVVAEFSDTYEDDNIFYLDEEEEEENITNSITNNNEGVEKEEEKDDDDDDKEFEFPSHVAPIEPLVFPVFGRTLVNNSVQRNRNPLWKLMNEERETATSCSSSESSDDLEGVPEETYCVWNPAVASPGKSYSAGSSKRWKIRDLLFRSNSEGKGSFVIMSSSKADIGGRGEGVRTGKIS